MELKHNLKYLVIPLLIIGSPIILIIGLYRWFIDLWYLYWYGVSSEIYYMSDTDIKFNLINECGIKGDPIYDRKMLLREWNRRHR